MIDFSPAKWIWTKDNVTPDQKVLVQKRFTLDKRVESAVAYISAETKFWLWINGRLAVLEGGVFRESRKGCGYAERVDIAPYLKTGENTLTALVWFYGNGGRNNVNPGRGGFIFKCDALGLYSDSDFLIANHPAYVKTLPPHPSHLYGGENVGFDANLDVGDFTCADFTFDGFGAATEYENDVWGDLIESPLPLLKVYPKKELLFTKTDVGLVAPLPYAMAMSPSFTLRAEGGERVDIRTDRYTVSGGPGDEVHAYNGHRIEFICKKGLNRFDCPMYLYGEQVVITCPDSVKFEQLSFTESGYFTEQVGTFVTDNPLFNRLIEKSVRTLYVCMRNNFMDCPDRERGQWIGDVSAQAPQVFFVFDDNAKKLLKKSICDFIYLRKGDVLLGNVPGEHSSELPAQSLVAISEFGLVGEYYHYSRDGEIPSLVLEPAVNYLKQWDLDDKGLLVPRKGDWRWFDHLYNVDDAVIENCLYVAAAKFALKLAGECGNHRYDDFLNQRIDTLTASIEKHFWQGEYYASQNFVDERANAIAVLSGVCPAERYAQVRKILLTVCHSTPYFERFVLLALCEMGFVKDAYNRMMCRYYGLATNENSTMWEDFFILGTKNHAWSGCPLEIAFKYILGLKTDDGFKSYVVSPVEGIFNQINCTFAADGKRVEKQLSFDKK